MQSSPESTSACIVLDSNIWRSELMLRTPRGAALIFAAKRTGSTIGLPEIVEKEVVKVIVNAGIEAATAVSENLETIAIITGSKPDINIPTEDVLAGSVRAQFDQLAPLILRIPFSFKPAASALDKVIQGLPPSSSSHEEFRDTAIWEAVTELADLRPVHFVTGDKAFFLDREPQKGPAKNITIDIERSSNRITLYAELSACLLALQRDSPPLQLEPLAVVIEKLIQPELVHLANQRNFELGPMIQNSVEPFLTERVSVLALDFRLTHHLDDRSSGENGVRLDATVMSTGSCTLNLDSNTVADLHKGSEVFSWHDENGVPHQNINHYAYGSITLGRQSIPHTLRTPLDKTE